MCCLCFRVNETLVDWLLLAFLFASFNCFFKSFFLCTGLPVSALDCCCWPFLPVDACDGLAVGVFKYLNPNVVDSVWVSTLTTFLSNLEPFLSKANWTESADSRKTSPMLKWLSVGFSLKTFKRTTRPLSLKKSPTIDWIISNLARKGRFRMTTLWKILGW